MRPLQRGKGITRFLRYRRGDEDLVSYAEESLRVVRWLEGRLALTERRLTEARAALPPPPSREAAERGRRNRWANTTPEQRRAHAAMMQAARWPRPSEDLRG